MYVDEIVNASVSECVRLHVFMRFCVCVGSSALMTEPQLNLIFLCAYEGYSKIIRQ